MPSSNSAQSSSSKPTPRSPLATKQQSSNNKDKTPGNCQQAKSWTPPSLEKTDRPHKRLNLKSSNMEVDPQIENHSLTQDSTNITCSNEDVDTTRRNPAMDNRALAVDTRSNNELTAATGCNVKHTNEATGQNNSTTESNIKDVTVTNPFQIDDIETLNDLSPELAKMGRILVREITESLFTALIPLQNEINELKRLNTCVANSDNRQNLKDENEKLQTQVHQLEMNNTKLKMKFS